MSNKNTQTDTKSNIMTVKTSYARAVVLLLAVNFCLTTYAVLSLNKTTQEQIEGAMENNNYPSSVAKPLSQEGPVTSPKTRENN